MKACVLKGFAIKYPTKIDMTKRVDMAVATPPSLYGLIIKLVGIHFLPLD